MNAKLPILLLSSACLAASVSAASPWSVRVAATYLQTTDGTSNKAVQVDIEDKLIPEFDVSYAFNSHWSADLVLTIPQEHEVKVNGTKVGTFKHLPPTLLAKYNFSPIGGFTPYLGAGVNFTLIFDDDLLGGAAKLDNYSIGPAGQAGFDYKLNERWSLNVDVKRVMLRTDVKVGGATITEARLDPWLYSLGLRYQF
ncbi:MAG: OmpW family protein [Rariglobus sp.]|nr:OmpW family outer membrane protein [Rariglobus sp.]